MPIYGIVIDESIMETIKLTIMLDKYGQKISTIADLEDSFNMPYNEKTRKTIYLNPALIKYVSDIEECREYRPPCKQLGRYFTIHLIDGEILHARDTEFHKIITVTE